MKNQILFATFALTFTAPALAISDSCSLAKIALPAHKMSSEEARTYQQKLANECELTQNYRAIREKLQDKYKISLEKVTEYQAMRFVVRADFERAKSSDTPIQKVYQIKRTDYTLPVEQRSSVIWDNWEAGMTQLKKYRDKVLAGNGFSIIDLMKVHEGFFTLSKEEGDDAWNPMEGLFKPAHDNDNYWWNFNSAAEAADAKKVVGEINSEYRKLGLTKDTGSDDLDNVLRVKSTLKRQPPEQKDVVEYVDAVYSGDSRANRDHISSIFQFINETLSLALENKHMVWTGQLLTPMEAAYLSQKFYVGVHPFAEGNGRTSRFILELILTAFDMPHGSSGDLMANDVLMNFSDYYDLAFKSNVKLIEKMNDCAEQYKAEKQNATTVDYSCRILK